MGRHLDYESSLETFIESYEITSPAWKLKIGKELRHALPKFKELGLKTISDVWGCLYPELPSDTSAKRNLKRCLSKAYTKKQHLTKHSAELVLHKRVKQLAKAVDLPPATISQMAEKIKELPHAFNSGAPAKAEWFLGAREEMSTVTLKSSQQNYSIINVRNLSGYRTVPHQGHMMMVPDLYKQLGDVWDQAQRGTCVAQSMGALVGYLSGSKPSTQFLYHQCKMIDGSADEEGTSLLAALRALSDRSISGNVEWQSADIGIPEEMYWKYNPHYIEGNPAQSPPPEEYKIKLYSGARFVNCHSRHGKAEIIECSETKSTIIDEIRYLIMAGLPVVIGLPLYESFNNLSSRRTGRITLPLPGEELVGYHAMIVVAFDDTNNTFIVRNSWSTAWAWDANVFSEGRKLSGHAIIPYNYFSKTSIGSIYGYTLRKIQEDNFDIPEVNRLYNNERKSTSVTSKAAATSNRSARIRRKKRKQNGIFHNKRNTSFFEFLRV